MAKRVFKLGERIWDAHDEKWGTIIYLIHPSFKEKEDILSDDNIVGYEQDGGGENEVFAEDVYQLAEGKTYQGEPVVWEHSEDIDYPLFCPAYGENYYYSELD